MVPIYYYLICLVANLLLLTAVFHLAKGIKRFDLVDAAWGWAFIVPAVISYALQPGGVEPWSIQTLVTVLVIVWGGRLSWHIARRITLTDREDPRYVELRKKWHGSLLGNIYVRIYLVQAVLAFIVVLPVLIINFAGDQSWSVWTTIGVVMWLVGFACEVIGDRQMRLFIADPRNRGKIMTRGLWKDSRHPNYFGELTQWWGIGTICLGFPFGWMGIIGPILISYLILFVSGIPLNEKRFRGRPGWDDYRKRTSILIPLPPKE